MALAKRNFISSLNSACIKTILKAVFHNLKPGSRLVFEFSVHKVNVLLPYRHSNYPPCLEVPSQRANPQYSVSITASFRYEDEDEDKDQGQLLLIVRMLKSVTVMARQCCCNQLRPPGLVEDEKC